MSSKKYNKGVSMRIVTLNKANMPNSYNKPYMFMKSSHANKKGI